MLIQGDYSELFRWAQCNYLIEGNSRVLVRFSKKEDVTSALGDRGGDQTTYAGGFLESGSKETDFP